MNLSEVLTGATAFVVAMLVAHNESASVSAVDGRLVSGDWSSSHVSSSHVSSSHGSSGHRASNHGAAVLTTSPQTVRVQAVTASSEVAIPSQPVLPPPLTYGRARMIHAPTPCDVPTFSAGGPGAPYFVADGLPRAGQPFRVDWSTKPTDPGESPAWPAMLMVSFELSAPMPLAAIGAPGCHLLVQPDHIMTPQAGSILTQFGGCISLDWTPRAGLAGFTFYAQLLVGAPSVNAGGFLVSPALHIEVGS